MHQITVSNIQVDVIRKDIKNLHLAVYPPGGRVRVAAPLRVNDDAVRLAVISRLGWIKRQQARYLDQERQSKREYVSGESHYFQGHRYRLNVIHRDETPWVKLRNKTIMDVCVRPGSTPAQRERLLTAWYRQELQAMLPPLIYKWTAFLGVELAEWGIKRMKTRWGTCNIEARRIWLNLELVKKPAHCLEYIVVHELVHLLERHHNERFTAHMDRALPHWRFLRDELNRAPLSNERWSY